MIQSFKHRGLKRLYEHDDESKVNQFQLPKIKRILTALDVATRPEDLDLPGWRFHRLHGGLKGHYSLWVSGNWRIIFRFGDGPQGVDLVDYH